MSSTLWHNIKVLLGLYGGNGKSSGNYCTVESKNSTSSHPDTDFSQDSTVLSTLRKRLVLGRSRGGRGGGGGGFIIRVKGFSRIHIFHLSSDFWIHHHITTNPKPQALNPPTYAMAHDEALICTTPPWLSNEGNQSTLTTPSTCGRSLNQLQNVAKGFSIFRAPWKSHRFFW